MFFVTINHIIFTESTRIVNKSFSPSKRKSSEDCMFFVTTNHIIFTKSTGIVYKSFYNEEILKLRIKRIFYEYFNWLDS